MYVVVTITTCMFQISLFVLTWNFIMTKQFACDYEVDAIVEGSQ
jgi:hypothetical protein